jgi:hypothetical protein
MTRIQSYLNVLPQAKLEKYQTGITVTIGYFEPDLEHPG